MTWTSHCRSCAGGRLLRDRVQRGTRASMWRVLSLQRSPGYSRLLSVSTTGTCRLSRWQNEKEWEKERKREWGRVWRWKEREMETIFFDIIVLCLLRYSFTYKHNCKSITEWKRENVQNLWQTKLSWHQTSHPFEFTLWLIRRSVYLN